MEYTKNAGIARLQRITERHPRRILIGMVITLLLSLLIGIVRLMNMGSDSEQEVLNQITATTTAVGKSAKKGQLTGLNINEMYRKANEIMQKDSMTASDRAYLKMVDSSFQVLMK